MNNAVSRQLRRYIAGIIVFAGAVFLVPSTVGATSSGYSPPPGAGSGNPGGFTSVLLAQTVDSSGGVFTAVDGASTISINVPAGTFASPVELVITTGDCTGITSADVADGECTVAIGVTVDDLSTGQPISGTFTPVGVSIANASFSAGDTLVAFDASSDTFVTYAATFSTGSVTFSINQDPSFGVFEPLATVPVPATGSGMQLPLGVLLGLTGIVVVAFTPRRSRSHAETA